MNTTLNAKITASDAASLLGVSLQYIHKQLKTKNLKSFKNQNGTFIYHNKSSCKL